MAPTSMNSKLSSWPISKLETNPKAVLERVCKSHRPVVLTQEGQGVAVVIDVDGYQDLVEELALLRDIQNGLADVEAGRVISHEEFSALLRERYAQ